MIDGVAKQTPFEGALAGFADNLQWSEDGAGDVEASASLRPHLLRFKASAGGPWPAVCSLWGQIYFNALLIPATCLLASDWPTSASAGQLSASFCPDSGTPLRFTLCGERGCEASALIHLLDGHIARVIDELAAEGGLSKRMLWESVDHTLRWTVGEIAAGQPDRIAQLERLARDRLPGSRLAFPDISPHRPATVARKFCCLRYQLAGHQACPGLCPHSAPAPMSPTLRAIAKRHE